MKTAAKYRILFVNLLVALALTLIVNFPNLLYSGEMHGRRPPGPSPEYLAVQIFYFFFASWVVVSLNTVRRFPFPRKIVFSIVVTMLFYLCMPIVNRSGEWTVSMFTGRMYNPFQITRWSLVLIVTVLYGKIFDLLYQKQSIVIENERLKNENLQTRYNMLANQISPHFLFNSLNSLSMLVRERNNDKALEYIDRLADTFRYMLRSGQEELVTLGSELSFTEAYLYLLMVRYENKLFFDMEIEDRYRNWKLPVLSLQPLIENAVKHNCITQTRPFRISLRTGDGKLIVSNPSIPKIDPPEKTGIGLRNLSSRYQLLLSREVRVVKSGGEFRVELPLVEP